MKRKCKLLLPVLLSVLLLAGWGKKTVELLNSKKLIDLNAAIEFCMPGAEALTPEDGEKTENPAEVTVTPSPAATPTVTPRPTVTPKPTMDSKPRAVTISVRGCVVTCDSKQWDDLEALRERIVREANSNVTFRLIDDFAEAHVYRQLIAMLEELEAELGLSYIRD